VGLNADSGDHTDWLQPHSAMHCQYVFGAARAELATVNTEGMRDSLSVQGPSMESIRFMPSLDMLDAIHHLSILILTGVVDQSMSPRSL
jgi:hypothetical protein